jgi:hypothetical protein
MYIAACAFLMESTAHTVSGPSSREQSPPKGLKTEDGYRPNEGNIANNSRNRRPNEDRNDPSAKHSLLARAAKENYQRCYQALKSLEKYWAGTKYIVTVLDQKAKGIRDPLLYTEEDLKMTEADVSQRTKLLRSIGTSVHPTRVKSSENSTSNLVSPTSPHTTGANSLPSRRNDNVVRDAPSPRDAMDAIGWSLSGTTNSKNSNLAFLYPAPGGHDGSSNQADLTEDLRESARVFRPAETLHGSNTMPSPGGSGIRESPILDNVRHHHRPSISNYQPYHSQADTPPQYSTMPSPGTLSNFPPMQISHSSHGHSLSHPSPPTTTNTDAEILLTLSGSYNSGSHNAQSPTSHRVMTPHLFDGPGLREQHHQGYSMYASAPTPPKRYDLNTQQSWGGPHGNGVTDMMVQTQDVDMSSLGLSMGPYLEYLPPDLLNYGTYGIQEGGSVINGQGQGQGM